MAKAKKQSARRTARVRRHLKAVAGERIFRKEGKKK